MLVIHPDECIDCGVCEPECPAEAIFPTTAEGAARWVEINAKYAALWPHIAETKEPPRTRKTSTASLTNSKSCFRRTRRPTRS